MRGANSLAITVWAILLLVLVLTTSAALAAGQGANDLVWLHIQTEESGQTGGLDRALGAFDRIGAPVPATNEATVGAARQATIGGAKDSGVGAPQAPATPEATVKIERGRLIRHLDQTGAQGATPAPALKARPVGASKASPKLMESYLKGKVVN